MKKVISFQNNFIDKNLKDSISKFNKIKEDLEILEDLCNEYLKHHKESYTKRSTSKY
jgi:D-lyxose ketol-isomerase